MKSKFILAFGLCIALVSFNSYGQLGKLKDKLKNSSERILEKVVNDKAGLPTSDDEDDDQNSNSNSNGNGSNTSSPTNRTGGGLIMTPPNVMESINLAESSFKRSEYTQSRNAIRDAMTGVEMEIGQNVLAGLPSAIGSLPKVAEKDKVTSTGMGWVGLTIERYYLKNDQQLKFIVANNAAILASTNMYLSGTGYASTDQNWKAITIQGNKGTIEYNEYSGYKINVPLGQSSIVILEGINYDNESAIMAAAEKFDFNAIKKQLGEK
jgi:hypothetical protein